jgi:hypothetical protein
MAKMPFSLKCTFRDFADSFPGLFESEALLLAAAAAADVAEMWMSAGINGCLDAEDVVFVVVVVENLIQ